jgi:site-specific recombinase XerD
MESNRWIAAFERHLRLAGVRSHRAYCVTLAEFFAFLIEEKKEPLEVGYREAMDWRYLLMTKDERLSKRTVSNKLVRVRRFYDYLLKRDLVPENPFSEIGPLRLGKYLPKNILNVPEIGKLLENFAQRSVKDRLVRVVIELLYSSALRISEALTLKEQDVDWLRGVIRIIDHKAGGVEAEVPTSESALRELDSYKRDVWQRLVSPEQRKEGYFFPQEGNTSLRCLVNQKLAKECRRLGLKRITSHSFRHSAATHMLQAGAGIRSIQAILRHKEIGSTEVYTRVIKDDLKKVIAGHHPREVG